MPSYSPVFSSQFIVASELDGISSFLVPAGFTAVVRDFSSWFSAGGAVVQLVVQNSEAAPGVTVAAVGAAGVAEYSQWQGRVVVPAGGIMTVDTTYLGATPDIYVGGYLLRNNLT